MKNIIKLMTNPMTIQEKLRKEFETMEWKHWNSKISQFIRIPDGAKTNIADWWMPRTIPLEAIRELEGKLEKEINTKKMSMCCAAPINYGSTTQEFICRFCEKRCQVSPSSHYNDALDLALKLVRELLDNK